MDYATVDLRLALTDDPPLHEQPVSMRCPRTDLHRDKVSSLKVYKDNVHCFGCGFHLSRRRIHAALALVLGWWDGQGSDEGHWQRAKEVVARYTATGVGERQLRPAAPMKPLSVELAKALARNLWENRPQRLNWFRERGMTDEVIRCALFGHDGTRFAIPVFGVGGELLTIRYRRDDAYLTNESPKYSGTKGRNGTFLYGLDRLAQSKQTSLWVCEGELDTWALSDVVMVSPTNGAGQVGKVWQLIQTALPERGWERVVIMTDQDEPGEVAARELAKACEGSVECVRGRWSMGKDITEYRQMGGTLEGVWYESGRGSEARGTRRGGEPHPEPQHLGGQGGGEDFGLRLDSFGF